MSVLEHVKFNIVIGLEMSCGGRHDATASWVVLMLLHASPTCTGCAIQDNSCCGIGNSGGGKG